MVTPSRSMARSAHNGGIVYWQNRRVRRGGPQIAPAPIVMIVLGLLGAGLLIGQLTGVVHRAGPLGFAPAVLAVVALNGPLIAGVRAALRWLGG